MTLEKHDKQIELLKKRIIIIENGLDYYMTALVNMQPLTVFDDMCTIREQIKEAMDQIDIEEERLNGQNDN